MCGAGFIIPTRKRKEWRLTAANARLGKSSYRQS
jgi:hypothetical protein